jgi:hypothetical protein
MVTMPSA